MSGDFKVHGTQGLRIVDASVFPRVPGLFIISAVYMIGEKAADVIAAEAARFRALSAEARLRSIRGLIAAGSLMIRNSPKAAFLREHAAEQEDRSRRAVR